MLYHSEDVVNKTTKGKNSLLLPKWQEKTLPSFQEVLANQSQEVEPIYENVHVFFTVSEPCIYLLRNLCRENGIDLEIYLLSALSVLIHRFTQQEDILIGYGHTRVPVKAAETSALSSLSKISTSISGNQQFNEVLTQIDELVLQARSPNQSLRPDPADGTNPVQEAEADMQFPLIFSYEDKELIELHTDDVQKIIYDEDGYTATLALALEHTRQGVSGRWKYDCRLFAKDTIIRLSQQYLALLEGITANPQKQISLLPIMSDEERHILLHDWNNTQSAYQHDKCIHELFEQQVELSPDAVALKLYNAEKFDRTMLQQLTYRELDDRSNQLAHYLCKLGVGPEVLVGISMERSIEMVIAILGVLKSGGAYLPLDPSYPKDRLRFMNEDAGISILLSQERVRSRLSFTKATLVCLDNEWTTIKTYPTTRVGSKVNAENLCYVIYTSGSTGQPKGTLIIHRGVVNYLSWCTQAYKVSQGNGAPVNSSVSFDATVTSLFSPLLTGKTVLLLPEKDEIEALSAVLLARKQFSLVKITPAHLQILSQLLPAQQLNKQTHAFIIGGESLQRKSLELWIKHAPDTNLINEYGPTETVVGCCSYTVSARNVTNENVPIGRPIANTQIYLLDQFMQPVPIGVSGEIYIGGAGVARGYLNRPDLTDNRFVPNPFTGKSAKLYKTGDLGRFLPDGTLIFLGRKDQQVKIRGYRIELGEIDAVLSTHPSVQSAVVLAREDTPGDKRLVAYVVLHLFNRFDKASLQHFLKERLPSYMIPLVFVFLKAMPMTQNGKIDRAALPVPDKLRPEFENPFVAPRNEIELKLTRIFEDYLDFRPIGITDNFFDLGIHSIQAVDIFSRIRKVFNKQLHLATLLQAPRIEQMAKLIGEKTAPPAWSSLVPLQPLGTKPPLFCIHGGVGTVLFYKGLSDQLGPDQPFYGLQARGMSGIHVPLTSIESMASHYIREILTVQPIGPYYLGGYCFGAVVAFEIARQLTEQGQEIALLANFNGVSPVYVHPSFSSAESVYTTNEAKEESEKLTAPSPGFLKKRRLFEKVSKLLYMPVILKKKLVYKLYNKAKRIIYYYCFSYNRPLPLLLAKYYLYQKNAEIIAAYNVKPYVGQMIIFRSPSLYTDPHLGWTSLVSGDIKTYDIPGNHQYGRYIMNDPYVQILARQLHHCIEFKISGTGVE